VFRITPFFTMHDPMDASEALEAPSSTDSRDVLHPDLASAIATSGAACRELLTSITSQAFSFPVLTHSAAAAVASELRAAPPRDVYELRRAVAGRAPGRFACRGIAAVERAAKTRCTHRASRPRHLCERPGVLPAVLRRARRVAARPGAGTHRVHVDRRLRGDARRVPRRRVPSGATIKTL